MKSRYFLLAAAVFVFAFPLSVTAAPVQWSVNGHYYDAVFTPGLSLSWQDARNAAAALSLLGYEGHLATFTSLDEQDFVGAQLAPGGIGPMWLGGYQDPTAADFSEPGGGWRWITGEAWNTGSNAPYFSFNNNAWGYPENFLITWWGGVGINDYVDNPTQYGFGAASGYFVEYRPTNSVPEPTTMLLLGLGLVGLAGVRRKLN